MQQVVPKKIKENNPNITLQPFNTLLVDGSNLLKICMVNDKVNSDGQTIGGIMQFLLQIKNLMRKGNFRYIYVMWDGDRGGQMRYNYYPAYKANRDKEYVEYGVSDYMKEVNMRLSYMQEKIFGKDKKKEISEKDKDKELFHKQRDILMSCLDELFIRQCLCDEIEADDFIAYYVNHKKPEENIVIFSNDRDLSQLIHKSSVRADKDDVILCIKPHGKDFMFINSRNHSDIMGYDWRNVLLKKMICGDSSDNIKGIKGVGEKTLLDNFPKMKNEKVSLEEIKNGAQQINEERLKCKKKPLKWAENIVNSVTDGVQGDKIYEINEKIIDLSHPLMTEEAMELIDSMMYAPMDSEGRSFDNLYNILMEAKIDDMRSESAFSNFFTDFKILINKEKTNALFE